MQSFDVYLRGEALYGDDLDADGIRKWFEEEELGYFELAHGDSDYDYSYHALNQAHGFRHLRGTFERCLALGCARGDEVLPLQGRVGEIVAIEPAREWWSDRIGDIPARYLMPQPSGDLALDDASVDLITCFGVLHHIPNVSHVLHELGRVARPGAVFLLREPILSMGDWRKPRPGLTRNERGLPQQWLEPTLSDAGFVIERRTRCAFNPLTRVMMKLGALQPFNRPLPVKADWLASKLLSFNIHYWRDTTWKKLGPSANFYVLRRT